MAWVATYKPALRSAGMRIFMCPEFDRMFDVVDHFPGLGNGRLSYKPSSQIFTKELSVGGSGVR